MAAPAPPTPSPPSLSAPAASKKPAAWDEEEDGPWEAPRIPNPKCKKAGCGPWKRPNKPNPAFKGEWRPPLVDNPAYKVWGREGGRGLGGARWERGGW